jgi:SSS family solute:Na+ symporter
MSTTDGLTFIAALTVGRDIIARWGGKNDDHSVTRYTQIGVVFTTAVSVGGVLLFPSVIDLWYVIGTLFIPALLLPLVATYYPRLKISNTLTFLAMLGGVAVSAASFTAGQLAATDGIPVYPMGVEPMYAGLAVSLLFYATAFRRPGTPPSEPDAP